MRELIVATTVVLSLIAAAMVAFLPAPRALCMRSGGLPAQDGRCVARSAPAAPELVAELGQPATPILARGRDGRWRIIRQMWGPPLPG